MNKDQAINIVKQLGANYRGTLDEHNNIQDAIKTIENLLNKNNKI